MSEKRAQLGTHWQKVRMEKSLSEQEYILGAGFEAGLSENTSWCRQEGIPSSCNSRQNKTGDIAQHFSWPQNHHFDFISNLATFCCFTKWLYGFHVANLTCKSVQARRLQELSKASRFTASSSGNWPLVLQLLFCEHESMKGRKFLSLLSSSAQKRGSYYLLQVQLLSCSDLSQFSRTYVGRLSKLTESRCENTLLQYSLEHIAVIYSWTHCSVSFSVSFTQAWCMVHNSSWWWNTNKGLQPFIERMNIKQSKKQE